MTGAEPTKATPEWLALLAAFDAAYGQAADAGSAPIADHTARLRQALARVQAGPPRLSPRPAADKPVTRWLPAALAAATRGPFADMAMALLAVADRLTWEYGYASLPEALARDYAYCEILGPQGPILADDLILGLVLFAPGTHYPPHHHKGIEESYLALSGRWSQNHAASHAPGSLVLNPPATEHEITTGSAGPCLLAYGWMGDPRRLAAPGMVLS